VRDSDGTAIFTISAKLTGGSKRTAEFADKHHKPWIHISASSDQDAGTAVKAFIAKHEIKVLNVAGTRGSKEPSVGAFTFRGLGAIGVPAYPHPVAALAMMGGPMAGDEGDLPSSRI
jgi:hypothetical protein